jgi:hypothetical protein
MLKMKMKQMLTRILVTAGIMTACLAGHAMADTTPAAPITLVDGWNLKGATIAIDVAQTFAAKTDDGLANKYASVWTWNTNASAGANWQVFLADGSTENYATSKGFGQLVAINPGDGFWVNVNAGQGGAVTPTPYLEQYLVEYLPGTGMSAPTQGKTKFDIKITKESDNSPATGLTPTLTFLMHMLDGTSHSTPADVVSESTTPGVYNCTAYYLMASGPTMGTWDLAVTVGDKTTMFNPEVAMAMGSTTVRASLKGVSDMIMNAMGTASEKRSYYLFHDGLMSAMGGKFTFNLFIATKEGMFNMPAIGSGSTLMDELNAPWLIDAMTVEASTDLTTWLPAQEGSTGHWSIPNLTGLTTGQEGKIYVRMTVNGETKTNDGMETGTGYATFTVTPSSGM